MIDRGRRLVEIVAILGSLVLVGAVLQVGCGGSDDFDEPEAHVMGSLWSEVYSTIIAAEQADHTYLKALTSDNATSRWGCFGKSDGGLYLEETRTNGTVDLTTVDFLASQEPCKWPLGLYGQIGVCHQCANRGLYYTGKTVAKARGYAFFAAIYGTYGFTGWPYGSYALELCLQKAPEPQGLNATRVEVTAGSKRSERALFEAWFGHPVHVEPDSKAKASDLWRGYLNELLILLVEKHLGPDRAYALAPEMVEAQNRLLENKADLDDRWETGEMSRQAYMDELEIHLGEFARRCQALLGGDEYRAVFGMEFWENVRIPDIVDSSVGIN
ncbi:MAG: hypothetical protein EOM25_01780 [Deltaproteobacteria bacterium]|nr:hypothetical protein [Deltaproteobacteria bacterium]